MTFYELLKKKMYFYYIDDVVELVSMLFKCNILLNEYYFNKIANIKKISHIQSIESYILQTT